MAVVAIGLIALRPRPATIVKVGEAAPPITGTTLDGQPFDLASRKGHPVIVNFWYPTCVPCREEFPLLVDKLKEKSADGLEVVGVLRKEPDLANDFIRQMGATWPSVPDFDEKIAGSYLVVGWPQSYYIDRDGIVRAIQIGQIEDKDFETNYAKIAG